jgi:hypothetical protein
LTAKAKYSEYSFSKFLRKDNKSSDEFEFMLNKLTLEEIIALKLELSSKTLNGKLYGFNLWNNLPKLIKEALILFAVSATSTIDEAQTLLGVSNHKNFLLILKRYKESLRYYDVVKLQNRRYVKTIVGKSPKDKTT